MYYSVSMNWLSPAGLYYHFCFSFLLCSYFSTSRDVIPLNHTLKSNNIEQLLSQPRSQDFYPGFGAGKDPRNEVATK